MLSVIVATLNSERTLVATLAPLVAGAASGLVQDVIVADGGSNDGTAEIAEAAGCRLMVDRGLAGARLASAARASRAPWLLFLPASVALEPTWTQEAAHFIEAGASDRAAAFRGTPLPANPRLVKQVVALMKTALSGRHVARGLLIARAHYDAVGGHRDGVADPERDLFRRLGRSVVLLRSAATEVGVE